MNTVDSSPFCEWLFEVITPSLYEKIKQDGHKTLMDFLNKISEFNSLISKMNVSHLGAGQSSHTSTSYYPSPFGMSSDVTSRANDMFGLFNSTALLHNQTLSSPHHHAIFNDHGHTSYFSNCYLTNYTADLHKYLSASNQIESNLFYFKWLFNICAPLLTTLFLTLFLLPALVVIFLYTISIYLFLSKHWNKLKVSNATVLQLLNLSFHFSLVVRPFLNFDSFSRTLRVLELHDLSSFFSSRMLRALRLSTVGVLHLQEGFSNCSVLC